MLLAIDVGNTNTVLGPVRRRAHARVVADQDRRAQHRRRDAADAAAACCTGQPEVTGIALCSTVPVGAARAARRCSSATTPTCRPSSSSRAPDRRAGAHRQPEGGRRRPHRQHPRGAPPVRRAVRSSSTSAPRRTSTSCRRNGEFLGGALAPGIEISLDALAARAAQLRKVELVRPRSVIGKNTVEALQSGILYGFAGQVDGLVRRIIDGARRRSRRWSPPAASPRWWCRRPRPSPTTSPTSPCSACAWSSTATSERAYGPVRRPFRSDRPWVAVRQALGAVAAGLVRQRERRPAGELGVGRRDLADLARARRRGPAAGGRTTTRRPARPAGPRPSCCSCSTTSDSAGPNAGPKSGARPRPSRARRSSAPTSSLRRADQLARSSRTFQMTPRWPPGRTTRAISGSARSGSNQWNACADDDRVDARVLDRDLLGVARRRTPRQQALGDRAHPVVGLDRQDVVAPARRARPRGGRCLRRGPARVRAAARRPATLPLRRVARPEAVVAVGRLAERQPALRPGRLEVVEGRTGHASQAIASVAAQARR